MAISTGNPCPGMRDRQPAIPGKDTRKPTASREHPLMQKFFKKSKM